MKGPLEKLSFILILFNFKIFLSSPESNNKNDESPLSPKQLILLAFTLSKLISL